MVELSQVLNALSDLGALGASGLIIWALLTERLVPRRRLDEMTHERDDIRAERRANEAISRKAMADSLSQLHQLTAQIERLADELARDRRRSR